MQLMGNSPTYYIFATDNEFESAEFGEHNRLSDP